jgi:hypothetical protein
MSGSFIEVAGVRVFMLPSEGPQLRTGSDAVDLMSAASGQQTTFLVIPTERLGDDFFDLRTGIAGEMAQKFAMYGRRVAIAGDISGRIAKSKSLAAFVLESDRGRDLWFVNDMRELAARLTGNGVRGPDAVGA